MRNFNIFFRAFISAINSFTKKDGNPDNYINKTHTGVINVI